MPNSFEITITFTADELAQLDAARGEHELAFFVREGALQLAAALTAAPEESSRELLPEIEPPVGHGDMAQLAAVSGMTAAQFEQHMAQLAETMAREDRGGFR